ncbi:DNA-binding transcriptional response regulator [Neolewinella antarctica]|uniref:CheY-like chemotaxis protein n=1 Tax=Neolewinella antarctica TaxID=442734 RepID=A0ABX0XCV3_9BACT|nr:response regulator [Neolewinella antarctica]NJC27027.1 CheY-like chemotaxis protein [Neolewinella antarctica]
MNALLIHNDNLPSQLIDAFQHKMKFEVTQAALASPNFSFDKEADRELMFSLKDNRYNVVFLPVTLSDSNYLELSGLRLALHIRLSPLMNHTKVPIVFIGHESKEQLAKLSDYGAFLFTTGIFVTPSFDFSEVETYYDWIIKFWRPQSDSLLNEKEYANFLNKTKVNSSPNYLSHHSVENELALSRWSKYLNFDSAIPQVVNNINTELNFKHYAELYPVEPLDPIQVPEIKGAGSILLIDDEFKKGWSDFFKLLVKGNQDITYDHLDIDFKAAVSRAEIIGASTSKIIDFNPDVIILDLRLCDEDFDLEANPSELTGTEILKAAKKINPGISVIIFSATNKIANLQSLQKQGVNGFIRKDARNYRNSISELCGIIDASLLSASWLKKMYDKTDECTIHLKRQRKQRKLNGEFIRAIIIYLELAFDSLLSIRNRYGYDPSFTYYFLIIEACGKELIDENDSVKVGGKYYHKWRGSDQYLKHFDYNTKRKTGRRLESKNKRIVYNEKMLNVTDKANVKDVNIFKLVEIRNNFHHPDLIKNDSIALIQMGDTKDVFEVVYKLILSL